MGGSAGSYGCRDGGGDGWEVAGGKSQKIVGTGSYDFKELVAGEVRIFRRVGESWVGPLDANW